MLKFFSKKRGQKGFTLIELLVVIAIIGILATIVLVSLNSARKKARDTRRLGDLRQIAVALEMYSDDHSAQYPADTTPGSGCGAWSTMATDLETDAYMTKVPNDPLNTATYYYAYETDVNMTKYVLRAVLENTTNAALNDDLDTNPIYGCDCSDTAPNPAYCIQP